MHTTRAVSFKATLPFATAGKMWSKGQWVILMVVVNRDQHDTKRSDDCDKTLFKF